MIGLAGRLRAEAIDFSGFASPGEAILSSLRRWFSYCRELPTPAEAENLALTIEADLIASGWPLPDFASGEVMCIPAGALENAFALAFAVSDPDRG